MCSSARRGSPRTIRPRALGTGRSALQAEHELAEDQAHVEGDLSLVVERGEEHRSLAVVLSKGQRALGELSRKASTFNEEAQAYFDQGLQFKYAFAVRDAARAFAQDVLKPGVIERDEQQRFPKEEIKQLASMILN